MEKERKKSINLIVICAIVISLLSLSIVFAIFSSRLRINGEAEVLSTNWDLHFSPTGSIGPETTISIQPIITSFATDPFGNPLSPTATATAATGTATDISYSVVFKTPQEQVQYEFYVVNNGDYAAKISTVNKSNTLSCTSVKQAEADVVCNELTYTLKDENGNDVTAGKLIESKTSQKLILTLGYDIDGTMTGDMLPSEPVTVTEDSLRVSIIYSQN